VVRECEALPQSKDPLHDVTAGALARHFHHKPVPYTLSNSFRSHFAKFAPAS
jgi:hypothetical protein